MIKNDPLTVVSCARMWWWRLWLLVVTGCVAEWRCPEISPVSCSCDLPHTLRCTGGSDALPSIAAALRGLPPQDAVSLLDCSLQNVSTLPGSLLKVSEPIYKNIFIIQLVIDSVTLGFALENVLISGLLSSPGGYRISFWWARAQTIESR